MPAPQFVHVSYIAAPAGRVFAALTDAELARELWGFRIEGEWRAGGEFRQVTGTGEVAAAGEVLVCEPPRRLAITWRWALFGGERRAMPDASATCELEPLGALTRLTVSETHAEPVDEEYLAGGRDGWPLVVSRLKTRLETGRPLTPPATPRAADDEADPPPPQAS